MPHLTILLALSALLLALTPSSAGAQQPASPPAPAPWQTIDPAALRDETVRLLSEYLRIDTTNPPGNELAAARFLQGVLARDGIEAQVLDSAEMAPGAPTSTPASGGTARRGGSRSSTTWTSFPSSATSGRSIRSPVS